MSLEGVSAGQYRSVVICSQVLLLSAIYLIQRDNIQLYLVNSYIWLLSILGIFAPIHSIYAGSEFSVIMLSHPFITLILSGILFATHRKIYLGKIQQGSVNEVN